MTETQPWILNFFNLPQALIDEDINSSLKVICYLLFQNEDTAEVVFDVLDMLIDGSIETFYMVGLSSFFAILFGLPLGIVLTITKKGGLLSAPMFNRILAVIVNTLRSFPFIILIVVLLPFSKILIGTSIGPEAASLALSIAAIPFVARLFEGALEEVNHGIIEATLSMGASKIEVIFMMIAESMPSLINATTIAVIAIIGFSAMAGSVGGGGLGDLAIKHGFYNSRIEVLYACVIELILIVQCVQSMGDYLSRILRTHQYGILSPLINLIYRVCGRVQK